MYGREIGDTIILHGVIAITVFVRSSDVNKGAFQVQKGTVNRVASGVSNLQSHWKRKWI